MRTLFKNNELTQHHPPPPPRALGRCFYAETDRKRPLRCTVLDLWIFIIFRHICSYICLSCSITLRVVRAPATDTTSSLILI